MGVHLNQQETSPEVEREVEWEVERVPLRQSGRVFKALDRLIETM